MNIIYEKNRIKGKYIGNQDYYHFEQVEGSWVLKDPDGKRFMIKGVNNLEETSLLYPENYSVWEEKYGSRQNWIVKGVAGDLKRWGLNTIGWTRDQISSDNRYSRGWGVDEVNKEYNRFIELGATVDEELTNVGGELVVASVKDPWGNVIGIIYNPEFKIAE